MTISIRLKYLTLPLDMTVSANGVVKDLWATEGRPDKSKRILN